MAEGAVEAAPVLVRGRGPSTAARVARLVREAALAVEGVAATSAGWLGRQGTPDRGEVIPGVVATALREGYELSLHLVVEPVPLYALADRLREEVRARVAAELPEVALGPISVAFEDVAEPARHAQDRRGALASDPVAGQRRRPGPAPAGDAADAAPVGGPAER